MVEFKGGTITFPSDNMNEYYTTLNCNCCRVERHLKNDHIIRFALPQTYSELSKCCRAVKKRRRDGAQDDGQSEGPGERRPHRQEPSRRLGLMSRPFIPHLYIGVRIRPTPNSEWEEKSVIKDENLL